MIFEDFYIKSFEPLFLTLDKIGPFQDQPEELDFTDEEDAPCNFYLLVSENGKGKTTALEVIYALMNMLKDKESVSLGNDALDNGRGRAQLDVLLKISGGKTVVLSLLAGAVGSSSLKTWNNEDLEKFGATARHRFGLRRLTSGRLERIGKKDELVNDILSYFKNESETEPFGFEDSQITSPTLLYFSAYTGIYRP